MKGIASENDLCTLKTKLIEALGVGYEVEIHKEVSAAYGLIKELFDLVVFNHSDAICSILAIPELYMQAVGNATQLR